MNVQSRNSTRIAFLLGSGISIPAGMPSTEGITERIISGKNIVRETDGTYYEKANMAISDACVLFVVRFLNRLKVEIDQYYKYQTRRTTNYEDFYYVASQIKDSILEEYDNPAVQALIDKILPE